MSTASGDDPGTALRVGVVGAGGHSTHVHGPALVDCCEACPYEIDLRAVCDLDPSRAEAYADRFGFTSTYEEFDRMLAEESLDAVVAVTPISATRRIAGELLTSDVAVLIEKPPGRTVRETRELQDIAARHDADHTVSFNRRFNPAVTRAREWLADAVSERPPTHAVSRQLRTERFDDGFVTGTGIHAVDTVCSLLGRPERVSSRRWPSRPGGDETGECCVALATFEDATAQFVLHPDAGAYAETCELVGPGYTVRIDLVDAAVTISMGSETVLDWGVPDDAPAHVRNGTAAETRAFLDAVHRGRRVLAVAGGGRPVDDPRRGDGRRWRSLGRVRHYPCSGRRAQTRPPVTRPHRTRLRR